MTGESTELNLEEALAGLSFNLDAWTALISNVEEQFPDDIDKISLLYKSFLSKFPLCCGYWRKYADHKKRLCTAEQVVEVYEEAVESAPYSVDIWVDYCNFCVITFEDPVDVRRLFARGFSFVGKDYLCHTLWDKYIEFEFSQQHWSSIAHIFIQLLKVPTKKLHQYYDSFKKLVIFWEEEMGDKDDSAMNLQTNDGHYDEIAASKDYQISLIIEELQDPSTRFEALHKYLSVGEYCYQKACELDSKIHHFEVNACASHFCMEALSGDQLENWHQYLNFVEGVGDFDWAVKLYERCLICCAGYPEFWIRFVEYVESRGGRELAIDALERARYFTRNIPAIQLFSANFNEQIRDLSGARGAFLQSDQDLESYFIDRFTRKANMEKRLGNYVAASDVFREAIILAEEKMPDALPTLYIHFSRLQYVITNSVDAARGIIIDGIRRVPHCKLLLEELIRLAMSHMGAEQVKAMDLIIANSIMPLPDSFEGLNAEDREDISRLYMEFVDLYGTIYESRKAWNRHMRLFPQSLRANLLKLPARDSAVVFKAADGISHSSLADPELGAADSTVNSEIVPSGVARNSMNGTYKASEENHELLNEASDHINIMKADKDSEVKPVKPIGLERDPHKREEENHELLNDASEHIDIMKSDKDSEVKQIGLQRDPHKPEEEDLPLLDRLSLKERDDGSNSLVTSTSLVNGSHQEATISNGQVNDSAHRHHEESSTPLFTPRDETPKHHKDSNDKKWQSSYKGDGPSRWRSSWRNSEKRDQQMRSVSPQRHGSDLYADGKHRQENSSHPLQQSRSRWNPLESEKSLSPQQRFSPDKRVPNQSLPRRSHYEHTKYYDNSRARRGSGIRGRNDRWMRPRDAQIPTSVPSTQTTGHSVDYPQQAQAVQMSYFPAQQSGDQPYANMQSSQQTYNQMWQDYYNQHQQWQGQFLQYQQQQNQQSFPPQPQQQLEMQSHEFMQWQYQQWQLLYQRQQLQASGLQEPNQEQQAGEQPQDSQQPPSGAQPTQTFQNVQFPQQHTYQHFQPQQQPPQMQLTDQTEQAGKLQQDSEHPESSAQTVPLHQNEHFQQQQFYQQLPLEQQQHSHPNGSSEAMQQQSMYQYQQQYYIYLQQLQQQQQLPLSVEPKDNRSEALQILDENAALKMNLSREGNYQKGQEVPSPSCDIDEAQDQSSKAEDTGGC